MFRDRWLWTGVGLFLVGRIIDLIWHATHEEFETASDQVQAHAVVWIGVVVLSIAALRALIGPQTEGGYALLFVGTLSYAGVAAWHFWEHSRLRDPELPHLLLVIATVLMLAALVWIAFAARDRRPSASRRATARPVR